MTLAEHTNETIQSSQIVDRLKLEIEKNIGESLYRIWFDDHTIYSIIDDLLTIGVPNRFYKDWVELKFHQTISQIACEVIHPKIQLEYKIDPSLYQKHRNQMDRTDSSKNRSSKRSIDQTNNQSISKTISDGKIVPTRKKSNRMSSRFHLEKFLVGDNNRVVYSAIEAFLNRRDSNYSPLFIYGENGLGKTHLFRGVEAKCAESRKTKVRFLTSEEFTNEFVEAMRTRSLTDFRKKFRSLDVLAIDDIQFFQNKMATQEELLHTINALDARGAKILLFADRHPKQFKKMSNDLKSKFISGMISQLQTPDFACRKGILQEKAKLRNLKLNREIIEFLADRLHGSVSELEGTIKFLEHYFDTMQCSIQLHTVRQAMSQWFQSREPENELGEIAEKAIEYFQLPSDVFRKKSRSRSYSQPRMLAMYLARKNTHATYAEIGQEFGKVNHSTAIFAERKIEEKLSNDETILLYRKQWKVREAVEGFHRLLGK